MHKELVVFLLALVSICVTGSAEAQLFRRWGPPPTPQQCPQQRQQYQQQYQRHQTYAQTQGYQAPANRNMILVEVDPQGRVLRQILDSQQLTRMLELRRLSDGRIIELLRQQPRVGAISPSSNLVLSRSNQSIVLPGTQTNTAAAKQTQIVTKPVVPGYAVTQPLTGPSISSQVDIARQAVVALPTLAEAVSTVESSLIEPATDTPPGSLQDLMVPDTNVVPAAATEEVPGMVSVLDSSRNGVSELEAQEAPGTGAGLLTEPENN